MFADAQLAPAMSAAGGWSCRCSGSCLDYAAAMPVGAEEGGEEL